MRTPERQEPPSPKSAGGGYINTPAGSTASEIAHRDTISKFLAEIDRLQQDIDMLDQATPTTSAAVPTAAEVAEFVEAASNAETLNRANQAQAPAGSVLGVPAGVPASTLPSSHAMASEQRAQEPVAKSTGAPASSIKPSMESKEEGKPQGDNTQHVHSSRLALVDRGLLPKQPKALAAQEAKKPSLTLSRLEPIGPDGQTLLMLMNNEAQAKWYRYAFDICRNDKSGLWHGTVHIGRSSAKLPRPVPDDKQVQRELVKLGRKMLRGMPKGTMETLEFFPTLPPVPAGFTRAVKAQSAPKEHHSKEALSKPSQTKRDRSESPEPHSAGPLARRLRLDKSSESADETAGKKGKASEGKDYFLANHRLAELLGFGRPIYYCMPTKPEKHPRSRFNCSAHLTQYTVNGVLGGAVVYLTDVDVLPSTHNRSAGESGDAERLKDIESAARDTIAKELRRWLSAEREKYLAAAEAKSHELKASVFLDP